MTLTIGRGSGSADLVWLVFKEDFSFSPPSFVSPDLKLLLAELISLENKNSKELELSKENRKLGLGCYLLPSGKSQLFQRELMTLCAKYPDIALSCQTLPIAFDNNEKLGFFNSVK